MTCDWEGNGYNGGRLGIQYTHNTVAFSRTTGYICDRWCACVKWNRSCWQKNRLYFLCRYVNKCLNEVKLPVSIHIPHLHIVFWCNKSWRNPDICISTVPVEQDCSVPGERDLRHVVIGQMLNLPRLLTRVGEEAVHGLTVGTIFNCLSLDSYTVESEIRNFIQGYILCIPPFLSVFYVISLSFFPLLTFCPAAISSPPPTQ